jgi:hypothetical protein
METEALKFRSNKMYEAQMFQGDKGPGKLDDVPKGSPFVLIFFTPRIGQVHGRPQGRARGGSTPPRPPWLGKIVCFLTFFREKIVTFLVMFRQKCSMFLPPEPPWKILPSPGKKFDTQHLLA